MKTRLAFDYAVIYAALRDKVKAFAFLEKSYQERSWYPTWLAVDPQFDNLRGDARFESLLHRLDLPQ